MDAEAWLASSWFIQLVALAQGTGLTTFSEALPVSVSYPWTLPHRLSQREVCVLWDSASSHLSIAPCLLRGLCTQGIQAQLRATASSHRGEPASDISAENPGGFTFDNVDVFCKVCPRRQAA